MAMVHVLISVHTEDCINPETDEVPLRLAEICNRHGCQAVFKVTTEKATSLQRHGREDVIEALKTQDLGFHMTNHSYPPTVPVYTQKMSWDEGVRAFERAERVGYEEWRDVFGRDAATYCHGTATPFALPILRKWGIPTYAWSCYPTIEGLPMHYMGLLVLPAVQPNGFHLGFRLGEKGMGEQFIGEFDAIAGRLHAEGGGMLHISSHECEWVAREFWDAQFRQGKLVLPQDFRRAPIKSAAEIEGGYADFEELLSHVCQCQETQVITSGEFHELYKDRLAGEELSIEELLGLAEAAAEEITFHPMRGQYASAAEIFGAMVAAFSYYFDQGVLPQKVKLQYYGGPPRHTETLNQTDAMSADVFRHVLADVADYLQFERRVPAEVWLGNYPISPGDFLATMCKAFIALCSGDELPDMIQLARGNVTCTKYAPEQAQVSTWPAFPPGFADHNGVAMARLQCWTIKPAVRA